MGMSITGRILYNIEMKFCHNFKLFLRRHDTSMEVLFLLIYVVLQGFLIYIVQKPIIGVFILLFLFFISFERILLRFKSKLLREDMEEERRIITDNVSDFEGLIFELNENNKLLRKRIKILLGQRNKLLKRLDRDLKKKR